MGTLVILHGWMQNKTLWEPLISLLKDDYSIVALDLPGFGEEPLQSPTWGIPEYASFLEQKIEQLHLTDVVLLGHSFGGRISSYIASKHPEWLRGLILYAAPALYRPSPKIKAKILFAKTLKFFGIKKKLIKITELSEAEKSGLDKIFRNTINFDQTELLPHINVPTTIIWGSNDTESQMTIGKEMHTLIPNSDLIILDDVGHNAHIYNQSLFYGTLKTILKKF